MSLVSELYGIIQEIFKGKKSYWISTYGNNPSAIAKLIADRFVPKNEEDRKDIEKLIAVSKNCNSFDQVMTKISLLWDAKDNKMKMSNDILNVLDGNLLESWIMVQGENGERWLMQILENLNLITNLTEDQKAKLITWKLLRDNNSDN